MFSALWAFSRHALVPFLFRDFSQFIIDTGKSSTHGFSQLSRRHCLHSFIRAVTAHLSFFLIPPPYGLSCLYRKKLGLTPFTSSPASKSAGFKAVPVSQRLHLGFTFRSPRNSDRFRSGIQFSQLLFVGTAIGCADRQSA